MISNLSTQDLRWCVNCLAMSTRPRITFNQEVNLRLTEDKQKTQKEENRKKANKYIAEIGFELACFFNKKS